VELVESKVEVRALFLLVVVVELLVTQEMVAEAEMLGLLNLETQDLVELVEVEALVTAVR
jgi:hypothetical protein